MWHGVTVTNSTVVGCPCGELLVRSLQSPGRKACWCAWDMERPASNIAMNIQGGPQFETGNKNADKNAIVLE